MPCLICSGGDVPVFRRLRIMLTDTAQPALAPAEAPLALPAMRGAIWTLEHRAGPPVARDLVFLSDGLVCSGHQILWRWETAGARLLVRGLDDAPLLDFVAHPPAAGQALALAGRSAADPGTDFGFLLTTPLDAPPRPDATRNLNAVTTLGTESRTLLVTINSLNRPFDGRESRWEFYDLPGRAGVDHVRLAERTDPAHWYLDKTRRIGALLDGLLRSGYRQAVFCGLSSGGYASLLLAEMLSRAHPDVRFRTATINPQTGHAPAHRRFMATLPIGIAPALITEDCYSRRDCAETEIADLARLRGPASNVEHSIFYDAANPAEAHYVDLLAGISGITRHPYHFGVGHMSGCIALFERQVVQMDVLARCRETAA